MLMVTKLKAYVCFLGELANVNRHEWQIAIRHRSHRALYEGNGTGFYAVKNTMRYWFADPFLFSHNGRDFLFAEMFDRWTEKGVIGVCQIRNGKCGNFRVCLELPWHLSYPCVYEDETGIHMIPECYQSGEVWVYRCVEFPYRWEKERKLLDGYAVDTTPCLFDGNRVWLTTRFESLDKRNNDNLWQINEKDGSLNNVAPKSYTSRCAGHIITDDRFLIRPSQNCCRSYGENLVFNRGFFKNGVYQETPFMKVIPSDIDNNGDAVQVKCEGLKAKCSGLHTYNINSRYEVIDLRFSGKRSIVTLLKNWSKHMAKKIKNRDNYAF